MIRVAVLCLCLAPVMALAQEDPAAYRQDNYRAPVPDTLEGGTVISTEAAFALWKTDRVAFIDALPRAPKPADLPEGTIWHEAPRVSIPGALWLANVGYGQLAPVMHDYFRAGLAKASGNDPDHPLVFFCLSECWMSWNAAKRAQGYGYTHVFWYPQGSDGWLAQGYPSAELQPEPGGQ
ncbi:PQQ-dependent catabolism-associated CXXCW motif protein [Rhodobacter ferrooxidans]|uniref:Rhodanese domain-containing protein n=1 Tax=Rhodobacter ferrooxidans TaxID=371731 RepID=C8S0P1_9RHOB|nr:PQQ-dependent catabolism-associated CXXCW motif protein [Rhodobacter sp. SW2]EEW25332.1 conserved hypothetical protein [Rhodobacter sp. SW2]